MGLRGKLQFKVFRSSTKYWETLFSEAADFANTMGVDRVVNISTTCDHGDSVVTVWYWT